MKFRSYFNEPHSWRQRRQFRANVEAALSQAECTDTKPSWYRHFKGSFPEPCTGETLVLAAADSNYFERFGAAFLVSLSALHTPVRCHFHLINPTSKAMAGAEKLNSKFSSSFFTFSFEDEEISLNLHNKIVHYSSSRFLLSDFIMYYQSCPIITVDIDSIFQENFDLLYKEMSDDFDLSIFERNKRSPTKKILASTILFRPSYGARLFLRALSMAIINSYEIDPEYHVDQILLAYTLDALRRRGKIIKSQLPQAFVDAEFRTDAAIWTAKGPRKDSEAFAAASSVLLQSRK